MSTANDTDLLLVERNGVQYQITYEQMSTLNEDDLLLIERDGVQYKVEAQHVSVANGVIQTPVEVLTPVNNAGITYNPVSEAITAVERAPGSSHVITFPEILSVSGGERMTTVDLYGEEWTTNYADTNEGDTWTSPDSLLPTNLVGKKSLALYRGDLISLYSIDYDDFFDRRVDTSGNTTKRVWIYDFTYKCYKNTALWSISAQSGTYGCAYSQDGVNWTTFGRNLSLNTREVFATLPAAARYVCVYSNTGSQFEEPIYHHVGDIFNTSVLTLADNTNFSAVNVGDVIAKFEQRDWGMAYNHGTVPEYSFDGRYDRASYSNSKHTWTADGLSGRPEPIETHGLRLRYYFSGHNAVQVHSNLVDFWIDSVNVNGYDRTNDVNSGYNTFFFNEIDELQSFAAKRSYSNYNYNHTSSQVYDVYVRKLGHWIPLINADIGGTGWECVIDAIDPSNNTISICGGRWFPSSEIRSFDDHLTMEKFDTINGYDDDGINSVEEESSINYLFDGSDRPVILEQEGYAKYEPPTALPINSSLRIKAVVQHTNDSAFLEVNGVTIDTTSFPTGPNSNRHQPTTWVDIVDPSTGNSFTELSSFKFGWDKPNNKPQILISAIEIDGVVLEDNKSSLTSVTRSYDYDIKLTLAGNSNLEYLTSNVVMSNGVADSNGIYQQTPYELTTGNIIRCGRILDLATFSTNFSTTGREDWQYLFGYSGSRKVLTDGQYIEIAFDPPLPKGSTFELYCGNQWGGPGGIVINGIEVGEFAPYSENDTSYGWTDFAPYITSDSVSTIRIARDENIANGRLYNNGIRIDGRVIDRNDIFLKFDNPSPDTQYFKEGDPLQRISYWLKGSWIDGGSADSVGTVGITKLFDGRDSTRGYYAYGWSNPDGRSVSFTNLPYGQPGDYKMWGHNIGAYREDLGRSVYAYWSLNFTAGTTSFTSNVNDFHANRITPITVDHEGSFNSASIGQTHFAGGTGYIDAIEFQGKRLVDTSIDDVASTFVRFGYDSTVMMVNGGNYYADPANGGDGTFASSEGRDDGDSIRSANPPFNQDQDWSNTITVTGGTHNTTYPLSHIFDSRILHIDHAYSTTYCYAVGSDYVTATFETPVPFNEIEINGISYSPSSNSGSLVLIDSGGPGGTARDVTITEPFNNYTYIYSRTNVKDLGTDIEGDLVSPLIGFKMKSSVLLSAIHIDGKMLVDQSVTNYGSIAESQITMQTNGGRGLIVKTLPDTNIVLLTDTSDDFERFVIGKLDRLGNAGNTGETGDPANAIDFYLASALSVIPEAAPAPSAVTFTSQNAGTTAFTALPADRTRISSRTWTLESGTTPSGPWSLVGTFEDLDMNASQDGATPWSSRPYLAPNTYYRVKVAYNSTQVETPVESTYHIFKTGDE